MRPSSYIIIVIIAFFILVLHSIHLDDQRKAERRKQNLGHPVERRLRQRRKHAVLAGLRWALRSRRPQRRG